jgi:hypothetical protein
MCIYETGVLVWALASAVSAAAICCAGISREL